MLGQGVGLLDLVRSAATCVTSWNDGGIRSVRNYVVQEVCRFAACGQFRMAVALAECNLEYFPEHMADHLEYLSDRDDLAVLTNAVYLADLIDNFLAVMEADPRTAAVATGCRDDLVSLLILADLCEDIGRPLAAAEARYLHRLVKAEVEEAEAMPLNIAIVDSEDLEELNEIDWE